MDQIFFWNQGLFKAPILARSPRTGSRRRSAGFFATCTAMYLLPGRFRFGSRLTNVGRGFSRAGFSSSVSSSFSMIAEHGLVSLGSQTGQKRADWQRVQPDDFDALFPSGVGRHAQAPRFPGTISTGRRGKVGLDIYSSCMTVAEIPGPSGRWAVDALVPPSPIIQSSPNLLLPPLVFVILYRGCRSMAAKGMGDASDTGFT